MGITPKVKISKIDAHINAVSGLKKDIYIGMRKYLKNERDMLTGDEGNTKGYRKILSGKKRSRRGGSWSRGVIGQFKGYVSRPGKLKGLKMESGIFGSRSKLKQALVAMHAPRSQTNKSMMIIPIYQNLKRIGFNGPFFGGSAPSGMTNLAFRNLMQQKRLFIIKKHGKMYAFDKNQVKQRGRGFKRRSLLFIGVKRSKSKATLTGKYSFIDRGEKRFIGAFNRGQSAINSTLRSAGRKIK